MPPTESPQTKAPTPHHLKEMLFLAEQAAEGALKVLPSNAWRLHYPAEGSIREAKLLRLLQGKEKPEDVAKNLQPDALLYDAADIERHGLEKVSARIRNLSATVAHHDYERFAHFVASMKGKNVDLKTVQSLYDGIAQSRVKQRLLDAYGYTGKRQLEIALREEAAALTQNIGSMSGLQRVLTALNIGWLQRKGLTEIGVYEHVQEGATEQERVLLQKLSAAYSEYAETGAEPVYRTLVESIQESLPEIARLEEQMSPSMEKLDKELEGYRDQVPQPGPSGGPTFPPDASDLHNQTHQFEQGESVEGIPAKPIYEITPSGSSTKAMTGRYLEMQKSHFLPSEKTWSNKTVLGPQYKESLHGNERQTISGTINTGLKSLGLPRTYALDIASLRYQGGRPRFHRDQNGCFYVTAESTCTFSVDFLQDPYPFVRPPIGEDLSTLTSTPCSTETEELLRSLHGTPAQKAEHIRAYIRKKHWYPGGGEREAARALKLKIKTESTPESYLQEIEQSEYLDCDLSGTLGVHLLRRADIPATLGVGHAIDSIRNGKAVMDGSTGHAWAEFWDGTQWVPIDFTPKAKPQDKKKDESQNKEKSEAGQNANDGGLQAPPDTENDLTEQVQDKVQQQLDSVEQQAMGDATADDVTEGESALQGAKEALERMEQKQQELEQQMHDAKTFKDMANLRKETDQSELIDEMKDELKRKIDAKEEQLKEEMREELDKMEEQGFMDEERKKELQEQVEKINAEKLDALKKDIEKEQGLYLAYEDLKEEVEPLVEHWFRYFAEHLPRQSSIETDEDAVTRQGAWDRHAVMKYRNLLFGTLRNPRVIQSSVKPRFLASIMLDVSGSMAGEKLKNASKLLVFYCELFTRISRQFGYIRFSINVFSDKLTEIKAYDQDYDSAKRYTFADKKSATIKARLMQEVQAKGGTNMLDALKKASADLSRETFEFPEYVSAFYFLGDGGDTCGNKGNIQKFLAEGNEENGFGQHMRSAILLGNESERQSLAELFGDEHTTVAPDFDTQVEQSMFKFADDIEGYLERLSV